MKSSGQEKTYITDHMLFISLGLALFYWICESFLNIFLSNQLNIFELFFGTNIDEVWARIVVLCLFIIFGSHAQFIIDNRKKAEDALRGSEERHRTLVENIPIGICRMTPGADGRFLMANPSIIRMLGFPDEDAIKKVPIRDIYLRPRESETFSSRLLARKKLNWEEIQFKRADGAPVWGSVSAQVVKGGEDGEELFFDCIIEDIDERKKARLKMEQDAETRRRFQKLLSPDLAEMVVSGDLRVEKGGTKRNATVLFADIRGFTTLSENTGADEVVQMLNEYFEAMVEVVFRLEGTVDKYIGDAIMVLWGAPIPHANAPFRAVQAAIEMRRSLAEFNKRRKALGKQQIQMGIGINTGEVVAGYIGSSRTMSYSVIGDTVNTASRLCSAARAGQILVSDSTYGFIRNHFSVTRLRPLQVKGKLQPIHIFEVHGAAPAFPAVAQPLFPMADSALSGEKSAL
jgi:PAS domain S-box-containing protein